MPVMPSELYDALREAGATEDKARAAAEAVAEYREGIARLEARLDRAVTELRGEITQLRTELRAEIRHTRWMIGANTALILLTLGAVIAL